MWQPGLYMEYHIPQIDIIFIHLFIYLHLYLFVLNMHTIVCVCVWVYDNRCVYYLPLIPTGKLIQLNVSYVSFASSVSRSTGDQEIYRPTANGRCTFQVYQREPLGYQNGRRKIYCKPLDLRGPNFETHLGSPQAVPRHLRPLSTFHFVQWKSGATLSRYNL